jgi:hypothetical protein
MRVSSAESDWEEENRSVVSSEDMATLQYVNVAVCFPLWCFSALFVPMYQASASEQD